MRHFLVLTLAVLSCSAYVGCDTGVPEEVITVDAANDPYFEPRSILERYKAGQAVGSESATFEMLVNKVKEVDPAKGELLATGFADIQKASSASARKKIASDLLIKIAPAVGGPSES